MVSKVLETVPDSSAAVRLRDTLERQVAAHSLPHSSVVSASAKQTLPLSLMVVDSALLMASLSVSSAVVALGFVALHLVLAAPSSPASSECLSALAQSSCSSMA